MFLGISGGVLLHEMIGHAYESDFFPLATTLINKLTSQPFPLDITVYDNNIGSEYISGLNQYDDIGEKITPFYFIKKGIPSKIPYGSIKDKSFGNMISDSIYKFPLPRMRSTKMEANKLGNLTKPTILKCLNNNENATLVTNLKFGNSLYSTAQFELVGNVIVKRSNNYFYSSECKLFGNTVTTLQSVRSISKDIFEGIVTCGKKGQSVLIDIVSPSFFVSGIDLEGNFQRIEENELWNLINIL